MNILYPTKEDQIELLNSFLNRKTPESKAIANIILELTQTAYCAESYGFEGAETFSECGECYHCKVKKLLIARANGEIA